MDVYDVATLELTKERGLILFELNSELYFLLNSVKDKLERLRECADMLRGDCEVYVGGEGDTLQENGRGGGEEAIGEVQGDV